MIVANASDSFNPMELAVLLAIERVLVALGERSVPSVAVGAANWVNAFANDVFAGASGDGVWLAVASAFPSACTMFVLPTRAMLNMPKQIMKTTLIQRPMNVCL